MATATKTTEIVNSFFAAYNNHDLNRMLECLSEDAELWYVPMGDQGRGKARVVGKQIWSGLIDAFPDLYVSLDSGFGDEQDSCAQVTIGGTQSKDFLTIANKGKHYDLPHAFILRTNQGGLIDRITAYWDNASFYKQLGKTTLD